ncbi:unnamed protein product, partial [Mesorhabditis spiculigera]
MDNKCLTDFIVHTDWHNRIRIQHALTKFYLCFNKRRKLVTRAGIAYFTRFRSEERSSTRYSITGHHPLARPGVALRVRQRLEPLPRSRGHRRLLVLDGRDDPARKLKFHNITKSFIGRGRFGVVQKADYYGDVAVKFLDMDHVERGQRRDEFMKCVENFKALSYLHAKNIIHGDLRSKNIFVEQRRRVLVTDVGLFSMKRMKNPHRKYTIITPTSWLPYLAPELITEIADDFRELPSNEETDVYALVPSGMSFSSGDSPGLAAPLKQSSGGTAHLTEYGSSPPAGHDPHPIDHHSPNSSTTCARCQRSKFLPPPPRHP